MPSRKYKQYEASSLSRGTWIEIGAVATQCMVALGRPSHEGRGLKCLVANLSVIASHSRPSHEGRGLKSPPR